MFIPKAKGKLRPLGLSTLRDRVCMTAAMLVLEPICEADLPPEQYAYRPGRNAQQAVVEVEDTDELPRIKAEAGVPLAVQSCHTAMIGDYVFEGHVPADAIARFLAEGSDEAGLAVPGMPVGSPGMEMGDRVDPYDIVTFDENGSTGVYESR